MHVGQVWLVLDIAYWMRVCLQVLSSGYYEVMWEVVRVDETDIGNYTLTIKNNIGDAKFKLVMEKGEDNLKFYHICC